MIKVVKFGGSSVANAEMFQKVKNIVMQDDTRKFVVVSACGKEFSDDHKVTDLLYLCEAHRRYGVSYADIFALIEQKYRRIQKNLGLQVDLDKEFRTIRQNMKNGASLDYIVSRGEYLAGRLMADYLGAKFVDAQDVIAFTYAGEFDLAKTHEKLLGFIDGDQRVVIPGFYGALPNGEIRVMQRGGSDITGAILANVVDADVYENWTDVSGFLVADPRIVPGAVQIDRITYAELRQMSYMGAKVLQDEAIFPVKEKNIPIVIRNTNEPENPGTWIMRDCSELDAKNPPHIVTGITGRKGFTIVTVVMPHSSTEIGALRKLLALFEEYRISIEAVPSTVDTMSVIVSSEAIGPCLYEIVSRIKKEFAPEDCRIDDHVALVAVVGRGMRQLPGASGRFLSEFGRNGINIKIITQCADELSVVVGVAEEDFGKAIACIYQRFIKEERSLS